jgi:two-component system OmpR family response regulator/two-component system response regulator CpxR
MARVLLIDDDELLRELLELRLQLEGFDVTVAGNGEEGIRHLGHGRHDVIILDLMMPVMDGLRFLRSVASVNGAPPVIVVSGAGRQEHEAALVEAGVRAVLRKPVEPDELVARVREVLGERA